MAMPVISLSSDIGQQDYLIGAIKGQLLSVNPSLNIVDISHYLSSSNYPQAAYVCKNAFAHFPNESIHLIILNLFEARADRVLIARYNNQYIICPDNGIITMIAGTKPNEIYAIDISHQHVLLEITQTITEAVKTFFAKGISTFNKVTDIIEKYPLRPTIGPNWMEGQILFIDHFENVVINISKEEFEEHCKGRNFKIVFKRNEVIDTIHNNYTSVQEGEKLAFFNSAGYLEIAINKGNMAGLFGLQGFNERMNRQNAAMQNKWFYQTVRVFFE
jgi:S-adenosylmethionine hydrolase